MSMRDGEVGASEDAGELAQVSAIELMGLYRSGQVAPIEVVRAFHERMDQYQDLNAILATHRDGGAAQANEALRRYREDRARPLEGVPVVVKDLIDTAGIETTYGSIMFSGHVPEYDAVVVQRVRAAGGIVIAKASTHEFAWGITGEASVSGPTRNPWDRRLVAGGSSAGSAVALAVGLAPLALGTDTAGSIRIPAAFCGVMGLKPTFGMVPTAGVFPLAPSLDTVGPMARTVGDLELLLSVIAEGGAARSADAALEMGEGLVVGVWEQGHQAACSEGIPRVFRDAAAAFADARARVRSVETRGLPGLYSTLGTTVAAEGIAGHRQAGLWPDRRDEYHANVRHRLELAAEISLEDYARAQRDRALISAAAGRVLGEVDVLLSPVSGVSPAVIGHDAGADVDSAQAREFRERVMAFTALQSLTGLPACTVPAGFDESGLPVGVQLTAASGREHVLLAAARMLVGALGD
jgi:aspartyl-tRNA(Asn)/glutamyl-tRNA(Gln) amidotransferase subunit A